MIIQNKYRRLVWVVYILVATNLSMGISYLYHKQQEPKQESFTEELNNEVPAQQRTRYFREQLNLSPRQVDDFRDLNRDYNRTAGQIQNQLSGLRMEMVNEMGKELTDTLKLSAITNRIGELHKELKNETISFYLAMKQVSTEEQQEKLHEIFISLLEKNEDVGHPRGGRRFRNNRSNVLD
jgi:Spy/CpxP family protein refolding chaperone